MIEATKVKIADIKKVGHAGLFSPASRTEPKPNIAAKPVPQALMFIPIF
jgi:hypothetical protein